MSGKIKYEIPELDIIVFTAEDIITSASNPIDEEQQDGIELK